MENVNVVIVDDNPMILNTLDEMISSEAGLSVIGRADNGKDAIDMIKDTEPDVVLLDLVMPRVDGITVVENIKKKTSMFKNPAFIILSAVGGEQMTEEDYAEALKQQFAAVPDLGYEAGETDAVSYAGKEFLRVAFTYNNGENYQDYLVCRVDNHMLSLILTYNEATREQLDEVLSTIQTVQ